MKYRIEVAHCCGAFCAKFFDAEGRKLYHETADQELYKAWQYTPGDSPQELRAEWEAKLNALKKLLAKLVEDGVLTQEQADEELAKWLGDNPSDESIDVTQEFQPARRLVEVSHA